MSKTNPRVTDNDNGEINVSLDDKELRGWSYKDDAERRTKMIAAREYVEGWCDASQRLSAELEAVYRTIKYGFEYGSFDFSVLRQRADHAIDGKPLPPHLQD